jgi:surfeit locus 1 family protein
MPRRTIIAAVVALAAAALFARFGVWQLHRLAERRALNAELASRLTDPPAPIAQLPGDTALAKYRRALVSGTFDYEHEIVITGRSRQGAPGVWIMTPLRPDDGGRAVLVNRGWVYSPDASTVDLAMWREGNHASIEGFVATMPASTRDEAQSQRNARAWREPDFARISRELPYEIEPFYVVELAQGTQPAGAPTRLEYPAMDEGPHKSYAIQWFSFAVIALYGVGYLMWMERKSRVASSEPRVVEGQGAGR